MLANDSDPNGDTLTVTGASATNGTVKVNTDGTITYTPKANFNGTDSINYTVSDGQGRHRHGDGRRNGGAGQR